MPQRCICGNRICIRGLPILIQASSKGPHVFLYRLVMKKCVRNISCHFTFHLSTQQRVWIKSESHKRQVSNWAITCENKVVYSNGVIEMLIRNPAKEWASPTCSISNPTYSWVNVCLKCLCCMLDCSPPLWSGVLLRLVLPISAIERPLSEFNGFSEGSYQDRAMFDVIFKSEWTPGSVVNFTSLIDYGHHPCRMDATNSGERRLVAMVPYKGLCICFSDSGPRIPRN